MRKTRTSYNVTFVRTCNVRLAADSVNASRHDENAQRRKRLATVSWTVAYITVSICASLALLYLSLTRLIRARKKLRGQRTYLYVILCMLLPDCTETKDWSSRNEILSQIRSYDPRRPIDVVKAFSRPLSRKRDNGSFERRETRIRLLRFVVSCLYVLIEARAISWKVSVAKVANVACLRYTAS